MDSPPTIIFNSILSEFNKDVDVDLSSREEKPPGEPTSTTIFKIQKTAKSLGFFLSEGQARLFHCLDPAWLCGKNNFLAFAAEKFNGDPVFRAKPKPDQERIFANCWSYGNLTGEYPEWLKKTEAAEKADAAQKALEVKKQSPPEICPACGVPFKNNRCPECKGGIFFEAQTNEWEFQEPVSLTTAFAKSIGKMKGQNEEPPKAEDIEF